MAEYNEDDARAFIASARWRYAWTYRKWAEHWYARKADHDDADWTRFARFVYAQSRPMHWKGPNSMVFNYWDNQKWMYWCAENEAILVNRAVIRDPDPRVGANML